MVLAIDDDPGGRALGEEKAGVEAELERAQRAGDDAARVAAGASLGTLRWWLGDGAGAVAAWRSVLPLVRTVGPPAAEVAARLGLARALAGEGAWDDAQRHLAAVEEAAARSGLAALKVRAALGRADLDERRGRVREALARAEAAWVGLPARGGPVVVRCCLRLGEVARAAAVVDTTGDRADAARIAAQRGLPVDDPPADLVPWLDALEGRWDTASPLPELRAWAAVDRRDLDGALAAFDEARIARAADGWPIDAAVRGMWSAGAMAAAGRARAASGLLAELEVLVEDADPELVAPAFDLARARVARAHGDETAAAALAAAAAARLAHPPLAVRLDLRAFHRP